MTKLVKLLNSYGISKYSVNTLTGEIDTYQDVDLSSRYLWRIPIKFGTINGNFSINNNFLTTLENCPKKVNGNFNITGNNIKSLKGCPRYVSGNFICSSNSLTSYECVGYVGGNFISYLNKPKLDYKEQHKNLKSVVCGIKMETNCKIKIKKKSNDIKILISPDDLKTSINIDKYNSDLYLNICLTDSALYKINKYNFKDDFTIIYHNERINKVVNYKSCSVVSTEPAANKFRFRCIASNIVYQNYNKKEILQLKLNNLIITC